VSLGNRLVFIGCGEIVHLWVWSLGYVLFFANTFVMEKSSICGWEIYLFCIILNTHRIALDVSTARFIEIALENQKDFYPGPRDRKKRIIQITTS